MITNNGTVGDIKKGLEQNIDIIGDLFFDITGKKMIALIKKRLTNRAVNDSDLYSIYNSLSNAYSSDETVFMDDVCAKIDAFVKNSVIAKLKENWIRLTDSESPLVWAIDRGIPARYALGQISDAVDIVRAIEKPESFSADKLDFLLETMRQLEPLSVTECQAMFKAHTIPKRYKKLEISLSSLLKFLQSEYGKQPNQWPEQLNIEKFIHDEYKTFAPQVIDKIAKASAEDLKERLLGLAQENPDLGLLFWE